MNRPGLLTVLLVLALCSCRGIGSGPDSGSFAWSGTWTSDTSFNVRGTFQLAADYVGSGLTGTLVLLDGLGVELSTSSVTGYVYEEYQPSEVVFHVHFGTEDGLIRFDGSSDTVGLEDLAAAPFLTGGFVNGAQAGNWHTAPGGNREDCLIVGAVQTSPALSIRDLCSDGTHLYAVVDGVSETAVYRIDPMDGAATLVTAACSGPKGIAYSLDGYLWVTTGNKTDGFFLYKYDASWSLQAGYPKKIDGMLYFLSTAEAMGWHGGELVCADFFELRYLDPETAQYASSLLWLRAEHAEGDGTHLWVTYSAPGYDWSSFDRLGTEIRILSPDKEASPFTIQDGSIWTASIGGGLYQIALPAP